MKKIRNSKSRLRNTRFGSGFQAVLAATRIPQSGFRIPLCIATACGLLITPLFAHCPVSNNATVIIHAPIGNLQVDTTGTDAVDVEVSNKQVMVREVTCRPDLVEIEGTAPAQFNGTADWKIRAPKSVNLDLVTFGGNINMGDSDGNVTLRTTGGSVVVGNIRGKAAIATQGGSIKSGNIGGKAELRSKGGSLEVGNIAGDAEFETSVGSIRAGGIEGRVRAETAGGNIIIREVRGDVQAVTAAGDISVGEARRMEATTAGGNITSRTVRGPFKGHTDLGDIRVDQVLSWIEATTGQGNIFVKLVPSTLDGDLHINLSTGVGDITVFLPERMKATIDASIQRPTFDQRPFVSDFPMDALAPVLGRTLAPVQTKSVLNGGGNPIRLHTSLGHIFLHKN